MTIGSILFGFALLILVALVVGRPFMVAPARTKRQTARQTLLIEKADLLEKIRNLDFEHDTGTVPTEIYEPQRVQLMQQAAQVMQKLDTISVATHDDGGLESKIEAAIAQIRGEQQPAAQPTVATSTKVRAGNGRFCSQCGAALDANDKFCASCGHKVQ
ncbi:MAG: zinc ribbon domain-containing protein [Chloroflexi bacterium]|nr:zinc ribbon domain-containing protein [Chloroflexota bacterium]